MSNFLLYTHILISQKINFVTEVRFSQKRSHIKNRVQTSLFHHVGRVCNYSKCVESVGVNVLLLYTKNKVQTSLFHHVGGVYSYSKHVENVGVNVLLLYIKNRVPTSLFHHVGGVCSYSKCVEMLV